MTIYIDPPLWPAHGTLFSHLISDTDLAELHGFADASGIPERAFDRDHYDVPQRRYPDLVAMGAREVSGRELVRRLVRSGLRIPARQRNESLELPLLHRWNALLPGHEGLGRELLDRWGEEHRHYHARTHLLAVLETLELLRPDPPRPVLLAAWFHDAVYDGVPGRDEERSAELVVGSLAGTRVAADEVAETARLVRLTASHRPDPGDHCGALLCDADLSVLGRPPEDYRRYLADVRKDYAGVSDADFATGRAAVVRRLLALDPLFHTPVARRLWLDAARRNLRNELTAEDARPNPGDIPD